MRLAKTYIEHLSWPAVIEKYDRAHALFYLDPPYWETAGYGVDFEWENYERMAIMAKSIEGSMIISINDHPAIRTCFNDLTIDEAKITYTVGGSGKAGQSTELIILNDNAINRPRMRQQNLF